MHDAAHETETRKTLPGVARATRDVSSETSPTFQPSELVVVGTGIQVFSQATLATQGALRGADVVIFAVTNAWAARWIRDLNPRARSFDYPRDGRPRREIYRTMVSEIVEALRGNRRVCAAFYGSAALFTFPAHEAVRQARAQGFRARMLPGVSSLDCLFADLGVDPGEGGCQIFEATDFLVKKHALNCRAHLVLFQLAMVGNHGTYQANDETTIRSGLLSLTAWLRESYPADHAVVIYEAATAVFDEPRAESIPLGSLPNARVSEVSSLYVPPIGSSAWGVPRAELGPMATPVSLVSTARTKPDSILFPA